MATQAEPAVPAQPAAIQRLDDAVVHRIAAGEVVQRPASALKEMVENSLDAGAKHITVIVKEGGLKYLQIQDDGCGIRLEDLPILCHRHTTSKLRAFEDLETISTLGFRGEALASISFVAHVTVTTMTTSMQHGYRAKYADGELLPPGAKPVAAVPGTSIIVEDMFYNMLPRRRAFKPGPEEHNLLADVLQRYAIYKAGSVGFTLKRQGEARSDLHTLPSASRLDVIRGLFGPELAASLLPLKLTGGSGDVSDGVTLDGAMGFMCQGYVSNLTYLGRRSVLVLFINGRPVEQGQLRRAIEGVYTTHNPKANKPWVYLDLQLPPRHVEVNVHPTKKEVGFLHQQEVIDEICRAVEQVLSASMHTRTFALNRPVALDPTPTPAAAGAGAATAADTDADAAPSAQQQQQQQPRQASGPLKPLNGQPRGAAAAAAAGGSGGGGGGSGGGGAGPQAGGAKQQSQSTYRPEKLVRTDHRTQSIEGFLVSTASAAAVATAAAAAGGAKRRRPAGSAAAAAAAGSGFNQAGRGSNNSMGAGQGDGAGVEGALNMFGAHELFSNASLHLQAAAAEEAAAAAELAAAAAAGAAAGIGATGGNGEQQQPLQQQQQQESALLRPQTQPRLPAVVTQLSSIWELLGQVQESVHGELLQLFKEHTWVGMADHQLALLQHGTKLYLINMAAVTHDLFRQLLLVRWEAVGVMQLASPLHVGQLMGMALTLEAAAGRWKPEPGASREELCEMVQALLAQKADMLREYVGLVFVQQPQQPQQPQQQQQPAWQRDSQQQQGDLQEQQQQQQEQQGQPTSQRDPQQQQQQPPAGLYLTCLPVLLEGYVPDLSRLPQLILQLARDVEWDTELECFDTLAAALADFYALQPLLPAAADAAAAAASTSSTPAAAAAGAVAGASRAAAGDKGEVQQPGEPMDIDSVGTLQQEQQEQPQQQGQQQGQQAQAAGQPDPQGAPAREDGAGAAGLAGSSSSGGDGSNGGSSNGGSSGSGLMLRAGHRSQPQREWLLRHVVMPAVKQMYRPPTQRARDGSVLLLTSMEKLFRVFERCGW